MSCFSNKRIISNSRMIITFRLHYLFKLEADVLGALQRQWAFNIDQRGRAGDSSVHDG